MKVYNYYHNTRVFYSIEEADPDPLIPGRWLIPADATLIEPPELKKNEIARFNEEEQIWEVIVTVPHPMSYTKLRELAYPSILDYIDGIVKNDHEQINKYIKACQDVKKKYPKPNAIITYEI